MEFLIVIQIKPGSASGEVCFKQFEVYWFGLFFFSRRSVGSALYQSTGSLHSDGHSSNSMSPAPSPSPTHALAQNTVKASKKIVSQAHYGPKSTLPTRPLSGSLSNLNLSTSRKWNSTNDFKDQGPLSNIRYLFFSTIQGVQQFPPQLGQAPALSFVVLLMMWSTNLGNFFLTYQTHW